MKVTRRKFTLMVLAGAAGFYLSGILKGFDLKANGKVKVNKVKRGLVVWYSQTGNTARYGKLIAKVWGKAGFKVDACDYREMGNKNPADYDIIAVGAPVFNYEVPENLQEWLKIIPEINGIPVVSFASFGGPEGNQHNTATKILDLLSEKGGVPVEMGCFMNMGTMPTPDWDTPGTLAHRHLPDGNSYEQVRKMAGNALNNINENKTVEIDYKITMRSMATALPLIRTYKRIYNKHTIDKAKCIGCGRCVEVCPTGAIDPEAGTVSRDKCIMCFGCLNNCSSQAVYMEYRGKQLYGFNEFMKRNNIRVIEPEELKG